LASVPAPTMSGFQRRLGSMQFLAEFA